ncbi:MAG: hypothetical protein GY832_05435 [Chloroflexi bacterium]|nr:hypothetical protein [Chloroflexota bacterium]
MVEDQMMLEDQVEEVDKRTRLINNLTIVTLGATVCLIGCYGLMMFNIVNPFAPVPPPTLIIVPTATIMPTPGIPTWTPTKTPTITPTPGPTNTRTPTLTPSVTPTFPPTLTFPPTATETPKVTLSAFQFTAEVALDTPPYGCSWTGIAGHVQDIDDNPLIGYPVRIWGAGIDQVVSSGTDTRLNTIYGNAASWEQFLDVRTKPLQVRVQLYDPYREDHPPISDEIVVDLPGLCGRALGYVVFTQNH